MKKRLLSAVTALCLAVTLLAGLAPSARAADDTIKGYLVPYTVQAGDTIYGICQAKGLNFDANLTRIAHINGLTNFNYMVPGKVLWLPMDTAPEKAGYYTLLSHTLVYGETPAALCQSYGIDYNKSYNMLSALNDNLGTFMAGQTFVLPRYSNASATAKPSAEGTASGPDTTTGAGYAAGGEGAGSTGAGYAAGGPGTGSGAVDTTGTAAGTGTGAATGTGTTAGTGSAAGTAGAAAAAAPTVPKGDTVKYYLAQRVLRTGDTVSAICAELGVNFDENEPVIRSLNNITNYNNMGVGQVVFIPTKTVPSGSYYRIIEHTIAAGDTALALTESMGLNYLTYSGMIQRLNPNMNLNMIYVGQKIYLPQYIANGTAAAAAQPAGNAAIPNNAENNAGTAAGTGTGAAAANGGTAYGPAAGGDGVGSTGAGYAAGGAGAGSGYTEPNGGGAPATPTPSPAPAAAAAPGAGTAAVPAGKIPKADTLEYYLVEHVLQAGETVSGVCAGLGVDFDANSARIKNLSNIADYGYLMPGKKILIPSAQAPKGEPYYRIMKHTFVTGDTVYDLCNAYGLDYTANAAFLQRLNSWDGTRLFHVGDAFYMPVYTAG